MNTLSLKLSALAALLLLSAVPGTIRAQNADISEDGGYVSEEERYRVGAWNWNPTGGSQKAVAKDEDRSCDPRNLYSGMLVTAKSAKGQLKVAEDYMAKCKKAPPKLTGGATAYLGLGAEGQIAYDYTHNRDIKYLEVPNPDGLLIRARLALQPGTDSRPLVIVKSGIHSNLGSPSLKIGLMLLFDEAPFHVLTLPSISGADWQSDNNALALGGLDEGRQVFNVARYVQSPAFEHRNRISSVHVLGFSLGGHATLYSALYNDNNPRPDGGHYIQSVFAGCPVVDLEMSVRQLYRRTVIGYLVSEMFWRQMLKVGRFIPALGTVLPSPGNRPRMEEYPSILEATSFDYYTKAMQDPNWLLAPFQGIQMKESADVWKYNRLQDYLGHFKKTPVFVWASKDDDVVQPASNASLLRKWADEHPESSFRIMTTPQGSHCAFPSVFGWRTAAEFVKGYILSHSPEFTARQQQKRVALKFEGKAPALKKGERYARVEWRIFPGDKNATLYAQIVKPLCPPSPVQGAALPQPCVRKFSVPLSVFGKQDRAPETEGEAQGLTRWLNGNVTVSDSTPGSLVNGEAPKYAEWTIYPEAGR